MAKWKLILDSTYAVSKKGRIQDWNKATKLAKEIFDAGWSTRQKAQDLGNYIDYKSAVHTWRYAESLELLGNLRGHACPFVVIRALKQLHNRYTRRLPVLEASLGRCPRKDLEESDSSSPSSASVGCL